MKKKILSILIISMLFSVVFAPTNLYAIEFVSGYIDDSISYSKIEAYNNHQEICIYVYGIDSLEDLELEILNENMEVINTVITDSSGETELMDIMAGNYYCRIKNLPDNIYDFNIKEDNTDAILQLVPLAIGEVAIVSVEICDSNGELIPNAVYELYDKDGKTLLKLATNENGRTSTYINATMLSIEKVYSGKIIEAPNNVMLYGKTVLTITDLPNYGYLITLKDYPLDYEFIKGDLDGNGVVNANDAAYALDLYKYNNAIEHDIEVGDIDENGVINANDAALILDIYKYGK